MISLSLYLLCKKLPVMKYAVMLLVALNVYLPSARAEASAARNLLYPQLVNKYYTMNENRLLWTGADANSAALRKELLQLLDNAQSSGLDRSDYHYNYISGELKFYNDLDADRVYTDAAIAYLKDLYAGRMEGGMMGYDGVSAKYAAGENEQLVNRLAKVQDAAALEDLAGMLEPRTAEYTALKNELAAQIAGKTNDKINMLSISLNYYRRIHHYGFKKCVVVNICKAMLNYYQNDSMLLEMKVVVGKPATKTPRFSAFCYEAIMYPYWNVPHSIAVKEIIPKYRRNRNTLNSLNLQVVDSRGRVVDAASAIASGFSGYRFRQSTGCDNALGVLKFNISDPYSVYMHDTDYKNAFKLNKRYLSHGCIRLEKPLELGDYLLPGRINKSLLQACVKSQTPTTIAIAEPVPVFVVYMPVAIQDGVVTYYKDIYGLLK